MFRVYFNVKKNKTMWNHFELKKNNDFEFFCWPMLVTWIQQSWILNTFRNVLWRARDKKKWTLNNEFLPHFDDDFCITTFTYDLIEMSSVGGNFTSWKCTHLQFLFSYIVYIVSRDFLLLFWSKSDNGVF